MAKAFRIYIIDPQPITRKGLSLIVEEEKDMLFCGQSENPDELLSNYETYKPHVVILDIALKNKSGIGAIKNIHTIHPDINILVFTQFDAFLFADHVFKAGALGYIMKYEDTDKIKEAIRTVVNGEIFVSENLRKILLNRFITNKKKKSLL